MVDYNVIGEETQRGSALHVLAKNYSSPKAEVLTVGAALTTETFVVNGVTYELLAVETDTAINVTGNELDVLVTPTAVVTMAAHGYTGGEILRVGAEFMTVKSVTDANTVVLNRGAFGSTVIDHVATADIFETATSPVAGTKTVPTEAIGTAATLAADIKRGYDHHGSDAVSTQVVGVDVIFILNSEKFSLVVTEALTGTTFASQAAVLKGSSQGALVVHKVTTAEASAGSFYQIFDFTPTNVVLLMQDGGVPVDGTTVAETIAYSITGPVVKVTEGLPAWANDDRIVIIAS